ncbi:MAG: uracil-DNA glycosylase family protein [Candidatus Phaeomarinobacter sp.]
MANEAAVRKLLTDIRACTACGDDLPHDPRPVLRASTSARICIVGQAPGTRVHASGIPFDDPSGDRLRDWLGVDRDIFYEDSRIAIVHMGFCFPGLDAKGGDKPPLKRCAALWREQLFEALGQINFTIIIGTYAQAWHLGKSRKRTVTETVAAWREYMPQAITLPHPSWRNNSWLKKNPWFESDVLPVLRAEVAKRV